MSAHVQTKSVVLSAFRTGIGGMAVAIGWLLGPWPTARLRLTQAIRSIGHSTLRIELERHVSERMLTARRTTGFSTLGSGATIGVDTGDLIQRSIAVSGTWEPGVSRVITTLLMPEDSFLDVGANVGYYSLLAAEKIGPLGYLRAIEASPKVHGALVTNFERNGIDPATAVHAAVVDDRAVVEVVTVAWANLDAVQIDVAPRAGEAPRDTSTVRGVSLSELAANLPTDRPCVVKIDIEGGEYGARAGIDALVDSEIPDLAIVIEVSPDAVYGFAVSHHEAIEAQEHRAMPEHIARRGGMALYAIPNFYSLPGRYPKVIDPIREASGFEDEVFDYLLVRGATMTERLAPLTLPLRVGSV